MILFTSNFPFGTGEPFLETEIGYLAEAFDKITIITENISENNPRKIPANCEVIRIAFTLEQKERLRVLSAVTNPLYREEAKTIRRAYGLKMSPGIFKTLMVSMARARKIQAFLQSIMNRNSGDSITLYSYWGNDAAIAMALLKSGNNDVAAITRVHGWDVYFEASSINYLPLRKFIARELDAVHTVSEVGKDYCLNRWKVEHPEKIVVSRLGVEAGQSPSAKSGGVFTLVSCSSMIPLKRIDLIIRALAELPKNAYFRWVHFGSGSQQEELEQLAESLLKGKVKYEFKGQVSNTDLLDWYKKETPQLFINVSSTEGVPVSIMEAMAHGIPAIATDVGGNKEIIHDQNGRLLPTNPELAEIRDAIQYFISLSESDMSPYQSAALKMWEENYNAEKSYSQFAQNLRHLSDSD